MAEHATPMTDARLAELRQIGTEFGTVAEAAAEIGRLRDALAAANARLTALGDTAGFRACGQPKSHSPHTEGTESGQPCPGVPFTPAKDLHRAVLDGLHDYEQTAGPVDFTDRVVRDVIAEHVTDHLIAADYPDKIGLAQLQGVPLVPYSR